MGGMPPESDGVNERFSVCGLLYNYMIVIATWFSAMWYIMVIIALIQYNCAVKNDSMQIYMTKFELKNINQEVKNIFGRLH